MNPNEIPFEQFFAERIKSKGISLKKLAEITGIAPVHIENILRGDFDSLPSSPYLRGYFIELGKVLDFDGEEYWKKIRREGVMKNSGELDTLPNNRFLKKSPPKYIWAIGVAVVILIYFAFQTPRILGKPTLTINFPQQNPYTTTSSTLTLTGNVQNANSLTLNGDSVTITNDGSWEKGVLLQNGLNAFQISANKLLGGQTSILEQILYEAPGAPTSTASTTAASASTTQPGSSTF